MDDEGLQTLMCEVEAILNGRPLTKISDDPYDLSALTPNHLLLLRSTAPFHLAFLAVQTIIADEDGNKFSI